MNEETKQILLRELKPWLLKDTQGRPLSPISSLHGVFNEGLAFKPYFDMIENMIKQIVGTDNILDGEFNYNDIVRIIDELLLELNNSEVVITPSLPPTNQRDNNRFYLECTEPPKGKGFIRRPVGVRVNLESGTIERLGEGIGKSLDDFYNILPWAARRRCHVDSNGTVVRYFGDVGWDSSDKTYDTMVEIPMFYYKRIPIKQLDGDLLIWEDWVSYDAVDGYYVHPAFIKNEKIYDKIYVGAYETSVQNSVYMSVPDNTPVKTTLTTHIQKIKQKGTQWNNHNYDYIAMEQMLLLISTASFNSQSSIGTGIVSGSNNTGSTKDMGLRCGSGGVNGSSGVNFFGVENLWANIWKIISGVSIDTATHTLRIGKDYDESSLMYNTNMIIPTITTADSYFMCSVQYSENFDYLYIQKVIGRTNNILRESSDYYYYDRNPLVLVGGLNVDNAKCGMFSFYTSTTIADSRCSRVICYPGGGRPIYGE